MLFRVRACRCSKRKRQLTLDEIGVLVNGPRAIGRGSSESSRTERTGPARQTTPEPMADTGQEGICAEGAGYQIERSSSGSTCASMDVRPDSEDMSSWARAEILAGTE